MIKLKTKIVGLDDGYQYIQMKSYKTKHTTTAEHICIIEFLVEKIMENDLNMTIDKLFKLIKSNYKEHLKKLEGEK